MNDKIVAALVLSFGALLAGLYVRGILRPWREVRDETATCWSSFCWSCRYSGAPSQFCF